MKDQVLSLPNGQPMTVDGVHVTRDMVMAQLGGRCTQCQEPAFTIGAFFPHDHTRKRFVANTIEMGAPPVRSGKERTMLYALCPACFALPDRDERIEAIFLGRRQDIEK
jgi:hypothetical protein